MVDFHPISLGPLIWRTFREFEQHGQIFDLPREKFWCPDGQHDLSVVFQGKAAETALGPAAGPQSQLVPNIVLSWLAGSRIIELKTVQINDELAIPRPCIDAPNLCYNVEWSQELTVQESLEEYVAARMLIEMLEEANILDRPSGSPRGDLQLDVSLGYDLAGIRSEKITSFLHGLQHCGPTIDRLREQIPDPWKEFRDLDFPHRLINNITLSTFHGCPPEEIEHITAYLLTEVGVDMTVKMNPTLLGREQVTHLLHDVMGYEHLRLHEIAYDRDIQFETAIEIMNRLKTLGEGVQRRVAVKFSNTLEVMNHRNIFEDEVMYLSGEALHVITTTLAATWREAVGDQFPISFAAGVDARNFADLVALGYAPVTTCTDLLRPGGYGRLPKYLNNLQTRMSECGSVDIPNHILRAFGQGETAIRQEIGTTGGEELLDVQRQTLEALNQPDVDVLATLRNALHALPLESQSTTQDLEERILSRARLLNTPKLTESTQSNPRYHHAKNHKTPRKIDSQLILFDCINCDKCIPVCPNDANFFYLTHPTTFPYTNFRIDGEQLVPTGEHTFEVTKKHQIANFADYCNECGNCDTFCPEYGGPFIQKPSFFGSRSSWEAHPSHDGFHIWRERTTHCILGRMQGHIFTLRMNTHDSQADFEDAYVRTRWTFSGENEALPLGVETLDPKHPPPDNHCIDVGVVHTLRILLESMISPERIHYVNAPLLMEEELQA